MKIQALYIFTRVLLLGILVYAMNFTGSGENLQGKFTSGSINTSLSVFPQYTGEGDYYGTGTALAFGDVNGDGYEDGLIGAPNTSSSSSDLPSVYLQYGRPNKHKGGMLEYINVVKFEGENANDYTGSVLATGDVNGDGFDDILISSRNSPAGGTARGLVSLIYGQSTKFSSMSLTDSTVVELTGEADYYRLGDSIATGDVNDDGYDDIFIGSQRSDEDGSCCYSGAGYLVYGQSAPLSSMDMSDSSVVRIAGDRNYDYGGYAVAMGDMDGDTYDDLFFSAPYHQVTSGTEGMVYLIRGSGSPLSDMSVTDPSVFSFSGEASGDLAGWSLATGDTNADGYEDVLIGSIGNDEGGSSAGAAYLIYGQASLSSLSLSDASVVQFTGEVAGDQVGRSSLAFGEFNGDGYLDIVLGAINNDDGGSSAGAVYFIWGQSAALSSLTVSESTLTELAGEVSLDYAGTALATGDANGDGKDETLVGAPGNDDGGTDAGAAYLIYPRFW